MNSNTLSTRLNQVAKFVNKYGDNPIRLADIGSDHAYLPCHLALNDAIDYAIAGEVVKGPYESALKEVRLQGLEAKIDVRLGDGFDVVNLNDLINTATICGMGGILIRNILASGVSKLVEGHTLILQPNLAEPQLRSWLIENDYHIIDEDIIEEHKHYYEIIVAKHSPNTSKQILDQKAILFGPFNYQNQKPEFFMKWQEELTSTEYIIKSMKQASKPNADKLNALEEKFEYIKEVLNDAK